jgi:hypothetical protein
MNIIQVEQLALEKFWPFGFYANCINPVAEKNGAPPREFFRDRDVGYSTPRRVASRAVHGERCPGECPLVGIM